ncbi:type II secretion system protein GspG [Myxococcaceae bacterium JPH2]|nr:type II secretion system protein GspG [Myxococcaceae bacterium JPH2]
MSAEPPLPEPHRRSPILWVGLVFAVLLLIAVVVTALSRRNSVEATRVHDDFAVLLGALERYRADHGGTLPEEGDLEAMLVPQYLPSVPLDPWGRPYKYSSNGKDVFLATFGRENQRGGAGEDQDHTNHDGHAQPVR